MTEREWLQQLYEDVRAYFRYEAEPTKQQAAEIEMRNTMHYYQIASQSGEFDDET